jgi:misacylated tRNA(Ala) deacylase
VSDELFRADSYLKSCEATVTAVDESGIRLDRTVFYPEGGGQPGDTGQLIAADGRRVRVVQTRKHPGAGEPVHVPEPGAPALSVGETVRAELDWERRHRHMRMHTCLHLLCSLVEGAVTGGGLSDSKGRLDFDLPGPVPEKEHLTAELNRLISENHPVVPRWITDEALAANPELVRTMSVKPPTGSGQVRLLEIAGIDLQPCGGTHVAHTGEIGAVVISKIENKGRQNRRFNIAFTE